MEKKSLMARPVDLLSRREYSRRELMQKLKPHAESEEELLEVLERLGERAWQSDQRAAEQMTRVKGEKYGSLRLRQVMREKGIDAETIEQALEGQDDFSRAQQVWQRKFGSQPATREERAKQVRFLAGRGFPAEVIRRVLSGAIDEYDD